MPAAETKLSEVAEPGARPDTATSSPRPPPAQTLLETRQQPGQGDTCQWEINLRVAAPVQFDEGICTVVKPG